ncbi:MAG: NAD-dependent epimerase/dehydratase family protein [Nitrospiria bacterium]
MNPGLKVKRIFLTGASGFVGARLAECLTRAYGVEVHALVRRFGTVGAARLARLTGVRMFYGDIRNQDAVRKASQGCSHFIHCATGTFGSRREQEEATVNGTRNLLEAAVQVGAERVVYFSSASVHDPARSAELIREEDALNGNFAYSRMKIRAEALALEYQRRYHIPVVVLRPACVWGPFSPNWTISAVELIRKEVAFLPLEGRGTANIVYIDNLVDAVYLALTQKAAIGQTFLISDDEPKTWGELYGGYARFLGVPLAFASETVSPWKMVRISSHNTGIILRDIVFGKRAIGIQTFREAYNHVPLAKVLISILPESGRKLLKDYAADREKVLEASSPPAQSTSGFLTYNYIARPTRELYGSRSRYSNEKAKRILGWSPRISLDEALVRTCQWLESAGYKERSASPTT